MAPFRRAHGSMHAAVAACRRPGYLLAMAVASSPKNKAGKPETNPTLLREGVIRRTARHITASGRISLKCIPALLDYYVNALDTQFKILGRPYNPADLEQLRANLKLKLDDGWKASQYSRVIVEYKTDAPPKDGLSYVITARVYTVQELFDEWVQMREPPLFGAHPDCKVMHTAAALGPPAAVPVLDLGAGSGRNAFPLARAGHPTTVVEIAPALVNVLNKSLEEEKLPVSVIQGDILDESVSLPEASCKLVILCEVVSHFREVDDLRTLFRRAASVLQPGGILLFSAFLSHEAYTPDRLCREASRAYWASVFTRKELSAAAEGFPFELLGDESVHDYEKAHLPADAWPPTGWFVGWATGHDVFKLLGGKTPIELRWVTMKRTGGAAIIAP